MAAVLAIGLAACSQGNKDKENKENKENTENKDTKKTLVAYFSASGVTKGVAQQLAEVTGADLHEIKPEQAYTEADLDWHNKQSRSSVEMQDKSSRPAITGKLENMADYEVIYVGFPIWWYTCCEDLKAAYPDVNWKEGKLLNGITKKDLEDWVKAIE